MRKFTKKNNKKNTKLLKKLLGGRVEIKKPVTRKKVVDDIYDNYLSQYFDTAYKGKDLDISSNSINWGIGVEHEAQLFHISKNTGSFKNTNILFDSQESTCYLTHDKSKNGSCCKMIKDDMCYYDDDVMIMMMNQASEPPNHNQASDRPPPFSAASS